MAEDISRHKSEIREKQRALRTLLQEWDPIGVYGPDSDCPPDEYDCLLGLVGRLYHGETVNDLAAYLETELRDHFGLDPVPAKPADFARRVHEWYWRDPLPGSHSG